MSRNARSDFMYMIENFDSFFQALFAAILGYFGWTGNRIIKRIDNNAIETQKTERDLNEFKLHVSENYAKDVNIQQSLARLHDRLDQQRSEIKADTDKIIELIIKSKK